MRGGDTKRCEKKGCGETRESDRRQNVGGDICMSPCKFSCDSLTHYRQSRWHTKYTDQTVLLTSSPQTKITLSRSEGQQIFISPGPPRATLSCFTFHFQVDLFSLKGWALSLKFCKPPSLLASKSFIQMTSIKVLFANSASSILIHNKHTNKSPAPHISCIVTDVMVTRMRGPALITRVSPFPGPRLWSSPDTRLRLRREFLGAASLSFTLSYPRSTPHSWDSVWVRVITEKCDHTRQTDLSHHQKKTIK